MKQIKDILRYLIYMRILKWEKEDSENLKQFKLSSHLILISFILFSSCSQNECSEFIESKTYSDHYNEYNRTLEEALINADMWFSQMHKPTRTEGRKVATIQYITSYRNTRSEIHDNLLYLLTIPMIWDSLYWGGQKIPLKYMRYLNPVDC